MFDWREHWQVKAPFRNRFDNWLSWKLKGWMVYNASLGIKEWKILPNHVSRYLFLYPFLALWNQASGTGQPHPVKSSEVLEGCYSERLQILQLYSLPQTLKLKPANLRERILCLISIGCLVLFKYSWREWQRNWTVSWSSSRTDRPYNASLCAMILITSKQALGLSSSFVLIKGVRYHFPWKLEC